MASHVVHIYINSHVVCVNGAFIVNALGKKDFLLLEC
jgi:hypothetical protein